MSAATAEPTVHRWALVRAASGAVLADNGVAHDVKIYRGAGHGFMNDHDPADATLLLRFLARVSGTKYDPDATQDARHRISAFLDEHLHSRPN